MYNGIHSVLLTGIIVLILVWILCTTTLYQFITLYHKLSIYTHVHVHVHVRM